MSASGMIKTKSGGAIIAVKAHLKQTLGQVDNNRKEIVVVKIPPYLIVFCYARPHIHMNNRQTISDILADLFSRHPNSLLVFAGDLNLPRIDWHTYHVFPTTQYKNVHQQFIGALQENNLHQMVVEAAHVYRNMLDLLCANFPSAIRDVGVILPGLSDHHIVSAEILAIAKEKVNAKSSPHSVRPHRKAHAQAFYESLEAVEQRLSMMSDVNCM